MKLHFTHSRITLTVAVAAHFRGVNPSRSYEEMETVLCVFVLSCMHDRSLDRTEYV